MESNTKRSVIRSMSTVHACLIYQHRLAIVLPSCSLLIIITMGLFEADPTDIGWRVTNVLWTIWEKSNLLAKNMVPCSWSYTLQPRYNTVVYSTNSVITRSRLGSHCLYFLCIRPSLQHYFVITLISYAPQHQCYNEVPVYCMSMSLPFIQNLIEMKFHRKILWRISEQYFWASYRCWTNRTTSSPANVDASVSFRKWRDSKGNE